MSKKTRRRAGRKTKKGKKGRRAGRKSAEFKRRSIAAKKGWRRRKAREKIEREAKKKPKGRGKLQEFIVTWAYQGAASRRNKGSTSRTAGFTVIARNTSDADLYVIQAVATGSDSNGADLTWMEQVPWDEVTTSTPEQEGEEPSDRKTIRALGAGFVALR